MTSFSPLLLLLLSFFSLQPPPWEGILAQTALSSAAVCDFRVHLCSAIGIYRGGYGAQRIFFNRQRKKIQRRTLNDHSYLRSPTLNLGTMWLVVEEKKTIGSYNSLAFFLPCDIASTQSLLQLLLRFSLLLFYLSHLPPSKISVESRPVLKLGVHNDVKPGLLSDFAASLARSLPPSFSFFFFFLVFTSESQQLHALSSLEEKFFQRLHNSAPFYTAPLSHTASRACTFAWNMARFTHAAFKKEKIFCKVRREFEQRAERQIGRQRRVRRKEREREKRGREGEVKKEHIDREGASKRQELHSLKCAYQLLKAS